MAVVSDRFPDIGSTAWHLRMTPVSHFIGSSCISKECCGVIAVINQPYILFGVLRQHDGVKAVIQFGLANDNDVAIIKDQFARPSNKNCANKVLFIMTDTRVISVLMEIICFSW